MRPTYLLPTPTVFQAPKHLGQSVAIVLVFTVSAIQPAAGYMLSMAFGLFQIIATPRISRNSRPIQFTFLLFVSLFLASFLTTHANSGRFIEENAKIFAWLIICISAQARSFIELHWIIRMIRIVIYTTVAFIPWQMERLSGFFIHANHLAYCTVLVALYTAFFDSSRRWLAHAVLLTVILVLTRSSGGMIGFAMVAAARIAYSAKPTFNTIVAVVVTAGLLVAVFVGTGIYANTREKLEAATNANVLRKADNREFGAEGSFTWRLAYWVALYSDFNSQPNINTKLFGIGLGSMTHGNYFFDYMSTDPHNDYLKTLLERGWVGLAAVLVWLVAITRKARFGNAILLSILSSMFAGNILVSLPYMWLFFLIDGLATSDWETMA